MKTKSVGFFVTCLVDLIRPQIAEACLKLLEDAGCKVIVPAKQSCCGQPAYNGGDEKGAKKIAAAMLDCLEPFERIIVPSGSCADMLAHHYVTLFPAPHPLHDKAASLKERVKELSVFLVDECGFSPQDNGLKGSAAYHDSCSSLRAMQIDAAPRQLFNQHKDFAIKNIDRRDRCCGFGGLFCVKHPDISNQMVEDKVKAIEATQPNYLTAGDLGCLMNIAGKLARQQSHIKAYHYAELLAFGDKFPALNEIACETTKFSGG